MGNKLVYHAKMDEMEGREANQRKDFSREYSKGRAVIKDTVMKRGLFLMCMVKSSS